MIAYTKNFNDVENFELEGFFVDWHKSPSPSTLLKLLKKSDSIVVAIDTERKQAIGFITAITDGVLSAYIPFLEVLPAYQGKGVGSELVKQMTETLKDYYMIDVVCDKELTSFYSKFSFKKHNAVIKRNYSKLSSKDS